MKAETIKIDRAVLQPWCEIAEIRGITLSECLEEYLASHAEYMRSEGLVCIAEEIADMPYDTRQEAEEVAERFEAFAIEGNLKGRREIGTVATKVVALDDDQWTIKVSYLSPSAKRGWRPISIYD